MLYDSLQKNNMKNLILDLRSNGGGYMVAATDIADKFFPDKKLLVYLSGRKNPRQDYYIKRQRDSRKCKGSNSD